MGRHKGASFSGRTIGAVLAVVGILLLFIVAAILFAPDKPVAPPRSVVSYEERPSQRRESRDWEDQITLATQEKASDEEQDESQDSGEPASDAPPIRLFGIITAEDTGKPIFRARVSAKRLLTPEEEEDWVRRSNEAVQAKDMDAHVALNAEKRWGADSTTPTGNYALEVPMPGNYEFRIWANGYREKVVEVEVKDGIDELETDFVLGLGASVSGRVTEAGTGAPVEGLIVSVVEHRKDSSFFGQMFDANFGRQWWLQGVTDENGYYTAHGLDLRQYQVWPNLKEAAYKAGDVIPYQSVVIRDIDEHLTGIDFILEPAGLVWGYVLTPQDEPVDSELVIATSDSLVSQFVSAALDAVLKQELPVQGSTEKDGYYELWGVPLNEEWRVYATSDDHAPVLTNPFLLTSTQRQARIDIFMFKGTTIYGRVVDPKGEGVDHAEIVCFPGYMKLVGPMYAAQAFRETRSDEEGFFTIDDLPEGAYQIFASKQGFKFATRGEPVHPDGYNDIQNFRVVLRPVNEGDHKIYGVVSDSSGSPLEDAHVEVGGLGTQSMSAMGTNATTNARGEFVIDGVESGLYAMEVSREGYSTQRVPRVRLNEATHVFLDARAVIRGDVVARDTGEAPAQGFSVHARNAETSQGISFDMFDNMDGVSTTVHANGQTGFEIYVRGGTYRLEARSEGYTPDRTEVKVKPGDIVEGVDLVVSRAGGSIEGEVVLGDGENPQGTIVSLVEGATEGLAQVLMALDDGFGRYENRLFRVGADGQFLFEQLPEGSYNVVAQHPKYTRGQSGVIDLAERESVSGVVVRLGAGGAVEGYVYRNGKIVPGVTVAVLSMTLGVPQTVTTDEDGYYYLDNIPTGQVRLTLVPTGIGDLSDTRSATVEVEEGFATRYDFGDESGSRVLGQTVPPPQLAGIAILRPPGSPVPRRGENAEISQFSGNIAPIGRDGFFEFKDVQPGEWQVDIVYIQMPEPVYLHTELIAVSGEEDLVDVGIWEIALF